MHRGAEHGWQSSGHTRRAVVGYSGEAVQPSQDLSSTTEVIQGDPDPKHISTSYVERLNWSVRTSMRRYTRLSNGFSRKSGITRQPYP